MKKQKTKKWKAKNIVYSVKVGKKHLFGNWKLIWPLIIQITAKTVLSDPKNKKIDLILISYYFTFWIVEWIFFYLYIPIKKAK